MIAKQSPIIRFLQTNNVQFIIPIYQRNYDWKIKQCEDLLNDIIAVQREGRNAHFIGSIVYIHEGTYNTSEVQELVIIDGQQRLTTLSILYVALYNFAKKTGNAKKAEEIYDTFLINKYVSSLSSKLKLKQTDMNSKAFEAIINSQSCETVPFSNITENHNYFKSTINENNFNLILEGLRRLVFVEISLEREKDNPQRIFESLNSTGLALSQSDLIRNYILMDLPPKKQNTIFKNIWNPIEENARDLIQQKSLVSDYIRDYLTLRNKRIPNKSKVYQDFKELYRDKKEGKYDKELEEIRALSTHYHKFINPSTVLDPKLRKELEYIDRLEINVAYPFLLQVFEDVENGLLSNAELIRVLKLIQTYVWRRFALDLPTNALNKIFMALSSEVDKENYYDSIAKALLRKKGKNKFPNNEELRNALKTKNFYEIKPKNRNYLFEMLENHNNREYVDTSNEKITIEHIFPQTPSPSWNENLSSESYRIFKEKHLNTIGNLTLSGNNGALGNKSFLEKKEMNSDEKEQGYQYSRLWLNNYLKTINKWDVAEYENRLELISERFLVIWPYPDVKIPEEDEFQEQNIFDLESAKGKKLEYFIFEDTKVKEKIASQMFLYILRELYEKNSQLLLSSQDILKTSRDPSTFKDSKEILNNWYTESNSDNDTKFAIIKKLLTLFGLEDEVFVKFSN